MNKAVSTPICDFLDGYIKKDPLRLHMPGHKGMSEETRADITEVSGADSLFEANGIIAQSERNASKIFGANTFYSTEGSSLPIRAMLYLTCLYAASQGKAAKILAGRNVHKTFLTAAALLDVEVTYIPSESYLSCRVSEEAAEKALSEGEYTALYVTTPDYLGACIDIAALRKACDRHGVLLLVDNAHGAYLKFMEPSVHPMDCGAHMCCDSAHKTLRVLTGGAYLHISKDSPPILCDNAKRALALFASTSPSYLILQSLDRVNSYLGNGFAKELSDFCKRVRLLKSVLEDKGFVIYGDEELKLTVCPKSYGYRGDELAELLRKANIEVEFSDPDFTVMMLTPDTGEDGLELLKKVFLSIEKREAVTETAPTMCSHLQAMTPKEAIMSPCETVDVREAEGRILGDLCVGCPPAVPLLVLGEIINKEDINTFLYYGIESVKVVITE